MSVDKSPDLLLVDEPTAQLDQLDQRTAHHVADTLTALLIAGLGTDLMLVSRDAAAAQDYQRSMASVRVIDAATCQSFSRIPGVRGVLALRAVDRGITVAAMPSVRL